ncbi:hypothetical protein [Bradyrhizobium sp.]|uniref:hypothetical protein n=1 Tax=Bradyrhizobium sp. TaxID=376 RepID=UPI002626FD6C|nr:hypothetical protein [Bradyrhizobium sp.]
MSEQAAGPASGEQGSLNEGISHSAETANQPVSASATETAAAVEAPVSEPVMSEPSMSEPSLPGPAVSETPKAEAVKAEASATAPESEAAKDKVSHVPGKVIVMSRGERAWTDHGSHSEPGAKEPQSAFGKRRIAAIAAVLALATTAGAVGGALATASLMHGTSNVAAAAPSQPPTLTASLSRIDSDIQALKAGLDRTSKLGSNQFNKTSERLDKLERAQVEPAKLAKLSEAIDKLHALPVPSPVVAAATPAGSAASKDITGSIASAPPQQQAAASAAPRNDMKAELGRLPTVEGWVLRDVAYGGALIDGRRRGVYEVYAGDMVPGLGRIDAVRRQDGHWVVVTSRGLIVSR